MPENFFITGTDTGVGKTVVSALLCAALDAIYWKPVQTGTSEGTDTETVMRLAQLPRHRTLPESYRFKPPVSPHLAARWAGVRIELRKIKMPVAVQGSLIAEGAGGVLVPLNRTQLMVDLMRHLNLPALLVAPRYSRCDHGWKTESRQHSRHRKLRKSTRGRHSSAIEENESRGAKNNIPQAF
jgi:dethiobiotin synthase